MEKVKGRQWTQWEVETAKSLYESGMSFAQIGREIERNQGSVRLKLQALGIHKVEKVYLYDIESVRGHLIDVEEAKQLTRGSGKKILFKCSTDGCENTKNMRVQDLVNKGFSCQNCTTGISYPESFFTAYLEGKGIPYETQVIYDDLKDRRYDFRIKLNGVTSLVETHGRQHYYTEDEGYYTVETIQESDSVKRNYAKNNNINYIELDCRESNFEFIREQIKDNDVLPNIEDKDIPNMLELMELNSKYPVKKIIKMYESGKSTVQIGEKLSYSYQTINQILRRNNIKLRESGGSGKRMVRLIETGILFSSTMEAQRKLGITNQNISANCRGKVKSAGKHSITSNKLHWETVSQKEQQAIQLAKQSADNHTDKDINLDDTSGLSNDFMALLG